MAASPPQISRDAVTLATTSLTTWMRSRAAAAAPSLLSDDSDDFVVLVLSVRRHPSSPSRNKPHLLPLPHPIFTSPSISVCLITDDRADSGTSPSPAAALNLAKTLGLPVSEAIGLSTLRTDYRPYESRRRLAASHDLFVADRNILPLLPRHLGKAFFSKKKEPLPVNMSRAGWPEQLRRILSSAFLYFRAGTCSGIKVGRLDMAVDEIVDNVMAVIDAAVEKVPKKWANVRSLHLRAVDSVALPIYQALPDAPFRITVPERRELDVGEVVDAEEAKKEKDVGEKKKRKKGQSPLALQYVDHDGEGELVGAELVNEEESGKKRKKKVHAIEVEAGGQKEETKRRKKGAGNEDSVAEAVELGEVEGKKKNRKKVSKRALEVVTDENDDVEEVEKDEVEDKKKGSKKASKRVLDVVSDKKEKKKGKKGNGDRDGASDVFDADQKSKKKKKKKKKETGGNVEGSGEELASDEELAPTVEKKKKKSKVKKSEGEKVKKTRT